MEDILIILLAYWVGATIACWLLLTVNNFRTTGWIIGGPDAFHIVIAAAIMPFALEWWRGIPTLLKEIKEG